MAEHGGYKHSASDKKLDQGAESANESGSTTDTQHSSGLSSGHAKGPGHDEQQVSQHDDEGKDRLFEHREQHDDAEKKSEKLRLAKDVAEHHHPVDDNVADSGAGAGAKHKG
jgi:hypothetical protein